MSYRASIRPNVVVPFHRWTTCGPRQLHTEFAPNIRTTSILTGPLSFMFCHFTIQNFILQFEQRPLPLRGTLIKINYRYDTIFVLAWTTSSPRVKGDFHVWSDTGSIRHGAVVCRIVNWKGLNAYSVTSPLNIWTKFDVLLPRTLGGPPSKG